MNKIKILLVIITLGNANIFLSKGRGSKSSGGSRSSSSSSSSSSYGSSRSSSSSSYQGGSSFLNSSNNSSSSNNPSSQNYHHKTSTTSSNHPQQSKNNDFLLGWILGRHFADKGDEKKNRFIYCNPSSSSYSDYSTTKTTALTEKTTENNLQENNSLGIIKQYLIKIGSISNNKQEINMSYLWNNHPAQFVLASLADASDLDMYKM